ncbi:MAG TPA: helix-turn-helix transcriptional regulator [Arenicellales bacterium]|nr:helix-turn-helix transcriptional regulator [Arenicellales bacterium]
MFTVSGQHAYAHGKYPYPMRKSIGERIRELRLAEGWSQGELARRIQVSRPTVTQWENGVTKNLRGENLNAVARAFGISVDELLSGQTHSVVREKQEDYEVGAQSPEEAILLAKYRHLHPDDRARIQKIIAALDAEADGDVDNG